MNGAATFKSHILRREEKGAFGIPFKRWLFAGLGGASVALVMRFPLPSLSLPLGLFTAIALLVYLTPRGGIPRYKRAMYDWEWRLRSAALTAPASLLGTLATTLGVSLRPLVVDGSLLFTHGGNSVHTQLGEWVMFRDPDTDGLAFVAAPEV